jgi:hypothetical protein
MNKILTIDQVVDRFNKALDLVVENYPPEEREEAKARILNAWSVGMFQSEYQKKESK